MKKHALILFTSIFISVFAACHSKQKLTATPPAPVTQAAPEAAPAGPALPPSRKTDGIFEPGEEQVKAMQATNSNVTLQTLKQGYVIYSAGACTNCHGPKSIYKRPVQRWLQIVDEMAAMAKLDAVEKNQVLDYVLSIKATQPANQN